MFILFRKIVRFNQVSSNFFQKVVVLIAILYFGNANAQRVPRVPVIEYKKNILDLLEMEINTKSNFKTASTSFDEKRIGIAYGSIYHFSRAEMEKLIAISLLDLLDQVPGVSVVTSMNLAASIAIRGMPLDNGNLSIYLDGVRANDNFVGDISLLLQMPIDTFLEVYIVMSPTTHINGSDSGLCTLWIKTSNLNKNSSDLSVLGASTTGGVSRMYVDFKNEKRIEDGISFFVSGSLLANQHVSINGNDIYGSNISFQGMFRQESRKINMGLKWKDWNINFVSNIVELGNYYISNRVLNYHSALMASYKKDIVSKFKTVSNLYVSLGTYTKSNIFETNLNSSSNMDDKLVPNSTILENLNVNLTGVNFSQQNFSNYTNVNDVINSSVKLKSRFYGNFANNFKWHLVGEARGQINTIRFTNKSVNTLVFGLTNKYERQINDWNFNIGIKADYILLDNQYKILPSLDIHKDINGWQLNLGYNHSYNMPTGFQRLLLGDKFSVNDNQFAHLKIYKELEGGLSFSVDFFHQRNNYLPYKKTNNDEESKNIRANFRASYGGEIYLKFKQGDKVFASAWYSIHSNYNNDFDGISKYFEDTSVSIGIPQSKFGGSMSYKMFGYIIANALYKFEDRKQNVILYDNSGIVSVNYDPGHYIDFKVKFEDILLKNLSLGITLKNVLETNTFSFSPDLIDPAPMPKEGRELLLRVTYRLKE